MKLGKRKLEEYRAAHNIHVLYGDWAPCNSHNGERSGHIVGGNHGDQYAWIVKKKKMRGRGWCEEKNNRLSVSVKGRSLGDVMKEPIPCWLAKGAVH